MPDEPVTYRELLEMLDNREARVAERFREVNNRIEVMDNNGTRAVGRIADRLETVVKELEDHAQEHKEAKKYGVSTAQWAITTVFAFAGLSFSIWAALTGG